MVLALSATVIFFVHIADGLLGWFLYYLQFTTEPYSEKLVRRCARPLIEAPLVLKWFCHNLPTFKCCLLHDFCCSEYKRRPYSISFDWQRQFKQSPVYICTCSTEERKSLTLWGQRCF